MNETKWGQIYDANLEDACRRRLRLFREKGFNLNETGGDENSR